MQIYVRAGQHSAALKQYHTCEQILRKEFNLDPQPETIALYKKIRKGDLKTIQVKNKPGLSRRNTICLQNFRATLGVQRNTTRLRAILK